MTKEDILRLRDTAEQTRAQFKERVTRDNKYDVSCEMVASSGITRALKFTPDIKFVNDETLKEFVVMVERKNVEDNVEVGDRDNDRVDRDNHVEHQHMPYKTLDSVQKNIIQFCSIPRSAREILDHIGYAYNSTNIANQIKPLLYSGFIEMTEPDKPNSKNQKYRKARQEIMGTVHDAHSGIIDYLCKQNYLWHWQ